MLIIWVHLATFVVVISLNAVSCESDNTHTDINVDNIDVFCPCLPRRICPRVFGTKPEDSKYLGDLMQCENKDLVRCCGASDSYVVGILKIISTTQVPEPDIFSRLNPEDDIENEIPDPGREYGKFTTMPSTDDASTEIADSEKVQDVIDLDETLTIDGRIDQEPAESISVTETLRTEPPISHDFKSVDNVIADNFDEKLMMDELTVEEPDKSESITEASETEVPISHDFKSVDDSEATKGSEAPIIHDLKSLDGSEITEGSIDHDSNLDASGTTEMPTIDNFKSLDGGEVTETPISHDIESDDSEITETPISRDFKSVDDSEITETEEPVIQEVKSLDGSEITATTETQASNVHDFNSLDGSEITEMEASIDDDFKSLRGSEITTTTETEAPIIQGFNALDDSEATEISQTETPVDDEFESLDNSEITEAPVFHDFNLLEESEITATTETESPIIHEFKSLDGSETTEMSDTEAPIDYDFKSLEDGNEATTLEPGAFTTEDLTISHRKPKMLNNVIMVYPNEMSGIPKTTPKNMPETNELKMFDEDMGMDLHLVFSKSTLEPNIELESTTVTTAENPNMELETTTVAEKQNIELETTTLPNNDSTTKQLQLQFGDRKRRRQYRPIRKRTTVSPTKVTRIKSTTSSTLTTPINLSTRFASFHKRRLRPQETSDSKIGANASTTRPTTKTPTMHEEEEILHTSDDDKTHQSRFKLFKARNRMNYLRRSTTTTTTTTTTELPIAESTHLVSHSVNLNGQKKGETKMDETLIHQIDTSHRTMITKVRDGLMAASTKRPIIAIPRSFGSADMDKRVRKVETMLASKMMNAYNEIKSDIPTNYESTTTEQSMKKTTLNTNRPYRGRKKFDLTDPRQYKEITFEQQRRRMRSTTIKPVNLNEDVTTTTRSRRRRPTTVMPSTANEQVFDKKSTQIVDSTASKDNQKKHYRRRVKIKRRILSAEPAITTLQPPLLTTTSNTIIETESLTNATTVKVTDVTPTEYSKITDTSSLVQSKHAIHKTRNVDKLSSNAPSTFKASPLWSIQTDEANDFTQIEDANDRNSRHSRNIFQPPTHYINGFVPVGSIDLDFPVIGPVSSIDRALPIIGPIPKPNKFADDTKVRYSLPIDVQVTNFS